MYDNEYFVVDLAACTSTGEIINNLSLALETLNHSGKKIVLKLNDGYLNQSQLLSIQSLVTSWGCTLDTVETLNPQTWAVAENMNIFVQKPIEKRVEDKYPQDTIGLSSLGLAKASEAAVNSGKQEGAIAIKEIDGLHFEADLDAIKKQEDSITSSLENSGISATPDFSAFEESFDKQKEDFKAHFSELPTIEPLHKKEYESKSVSLEETATEEKEEKEEMPLQEDELEGNKNSIGVYKKAYDDASSNKEWEDVDFYESPTDEPVVSDTKSTTYINQTLRSGQILESEGNVVVIGDCHPGSEIRAAGDITVWGVLSGIAHAGYRGSLEAKVRALKLNAIQLRIGSCYSRRPDDTNIPYIIRSSVFTPEEARVVDGEIVLYKMNQN